MRFVVPFKGLARAKSRWPLQTFEREALVLDLLARNLEVVISVVGSTSVYLASPDPGLDVGCQRLITSGRGLNQDLEEARERLLLESDGPMAVLLPDLPSLAPADVEALVKASRDHGVVVCPDEREIGTNALGLSPPKGLDFGFEGSSFMRYLTASRKAGLEAHVLRKPGLACDCDDGQALLRFGLISAL